MSVAWHPCETRSVARVRTMMIESAAPNWCAGTASQRGRSAAAEEHGPTDR